MLTFDNIWSGEGKSHILRKMSELSALCASGGKLHLSARMRAARVSTPSSSESHEARVATNLPNQRPDEGPTQRLVSGW